MYNCHMKKILVKFLIFIVCIYIFQCSCISAQTNPPKYSTAAIQIYNAGVALHKQGKYELAEQKYNQTLKMQPNFIEAKKNLAMIYQHLADKYYGESTYDKSICYAKKSLALKPNNVYCYNTIANCYMTLNDNENLINTYKKILLITPDDDLVMNSLANAYIRTNQLDKAAELEKKILLINPNDTCAMNVLASESVKSNQFDKAIEIYKKMLLINPNDENTKKNLSIIYQNLANKNYSNSEYDKAICCAKESTFFNPNNINAYHAIAQSYSALNNYEKANEVYKKVLFLNPNDSIAQQNLKYVNFKHSDKVLNDSINNLNIGHIAPESLYRLINIQPGIDCYYVEKMKTILDLIWSEPNGKALLSILLEHKTPINITNGYIKANASRTKQTRTFYLYGIIPIASFTTNSSVAVNIPVSHIDNFNNPNSYAVQRIYNLQVFIHEFGHAFMGIKNSNNVDSMEEEIGVSMIGYNIANKIITGKYLDPTQTETYSIDCLKGLLSDEHRDLPVYSGFNKAIQSHGIAMPYPEVYSNIPLMYKKLLSEGKVTPVPSFNAYLK